MRIDDKKDTGVITRREKKEKTKKASAAVGALFAGRLAQAQKSPDMAVELQQLKGEIDQVAEELEREPTVANFRRFRELLGTFARKITSEAYKVETLGGAEGQRAHEVITVIDKEADLLYHLVMRERKDQVRIAAQLMKIKGLVLDFKL